MTFAKYCAVYVAFLIAVLGPHAAQAWPTPTRAGVTINKPEKVSPGHVVFAGPDGLLYIISQNGNVLKRWESPIADTKFNYVRPLDNGNFLARIDSSSPFRIVEMDFSGNVVWEYVEMEGRRLHHDHERLPNGNTVILCSRQLLDLNISDKQLTDDCIIEVSPAGEVVWEWQSADHYDEFDLTPEARDQIFSNGGDWAHANAAAPIPENTSHADPRFAPGNIVVSYRHISMMIIVSRETDEILWSTDAVSIGQHDSHMLSDDLAGGGNILVFDNGYTSPNLNPDHYPRITSRIVEFNPVDMSLQYTYEATDSNRPAWWFFSHYISSVQRLPNGNTLINEGANGRIFEVTPDAELVWEFLSPVVGEIGATDPGNQIYRAEKVPLNWGQLAR